MNLFWEQNFLNHLFTPYVFYVEIQPIIGIRASLKEKLFLDPWISIMEHHQEGVSRSRPHFLTDDIYSQWKIKMQCFLKMQGDKVCNVIKFG